MKKPKISVHVKVAGFVDGKMMTAEYDQEAAEGTTLKKLFALIDKSGVMKGKVMKAIMRSPRPPTIMINGDPQDVPEAYAMVIKDGDEVAVMTPMAGG